MMENYGEQRRNQILKGFGIDKALSVGQLRGGDPQAVSAGSLKVEDVEGKPRSTVEKLMQIHKVDRKTAEVMHKHKVTKDKAKKMIGEKGVVNLLGKSTVQELFEKARALPIGTKRNYDGSDYIKTASGWEIQCKQIKKDDKELTAASSVERLEKHVGIKAPKDLPEGKQKLFLIDAGIKNKTIIRSHEYNRRVKKMVTFIQFV